MSGLWPAFPVAQEVGAGLGVGHVLQRPLPLAGEAGETASKLSW